jgi:hypothetical protein
MPINDLPKSLIDSVVDVVTKSAETQNKLLEKIVLEGLKKFGATSVAELSEGDQKALHAWTQIRLNEVACSCGSDIEEDDMPGDAPFHKDGDEDGEKKKELDEDESEDKTELKENIALGSDEIATNGAVGVADATLALPKHADVLHDTDPYTGITQYRLLLQYATNEGTRIYPPVGLPGAASIAELRTLVEGLPEFNEAVDAALVNAA